MGWSWDTCHDVDAGVMVPCRFGEVCWLPLCPYRHSGNSSSARWAAVWTLLAGRQEELVEVVKDISKECFSERIVGQTVPHERVQQWGDAEVPETIVPVSCRMR